jgi:hypothetical protein
MARHGMAWHPRQAPTRCTQVLQAAVVLRCCALRCGCHWVREVVAGTALCHAMPSASGRALRTAHAAQAHRGRVTYV